MGDCIESLLAYDDACKQHQWGEVDTVDAARFFREMSYTYYRINRVLEWDYYTTRELRKQRLHQVFPPKMRSCDHGLKCPCDRVQVPHASTMMCKDCRVCGCAFVIRLYRGKLRCRRCEAIITSMPERRAP